MNANASQKRYDRYLLRQDMERVRTIATVAQINFVFSVSVD